MWVLALAGVSLSAGAAKKTLVVGAGDCRDGVLLSAVRDFQDLSRGLLRAELLEHDEALDKVRPLPTRSLEDLERQVEAARSALYNGQNDHALELVNEALEGLARASPHVEPWAATAQALMLSAQINKNLDRLKESNEALRRIARVDPRYVADPDAWPPSTIRALDAVTKELQRGRKGRLHVSTLSGAGASVVLDGKEVGKTPLKLELPIGTYRLSLRQGDSVSFPRELKVERDEAIQVDLAFEGSLASQLPLCMAAEDGGAIRLAMALNVDRLVVLRNSASKGNPPYLTGVLYRVDRGERVRHAGIRVEQLRHLMTYLFTGQPDISGQVPPPPDALGPVASAPVAGTPPRALVDAPPPPLVEVAPRSSTRLGRVLGFVAMGAGLVTGVAGALVYAGGEGDRAALASLIQADGRSPPASAGAELEVAVELMRRIDANRTTSFTLLGLGAGAVVAGIVGVALFPNAPASVAAVPTRDGASLAVSGRW